MSGQVASVIKCYIERRSRDSQVHVCCPLGPGMTSIEQLLLRCRSVMECDGVSLRLVYDGVSLRPVCDSV